MGRAVRAVAAAAVLLAAPVGARATAARPQPPVLPWCTITDTASTGGSGAPALVASGEVPDACLPTLAWYGGPTPTVARSPGVVAARDADVGVAVLADAATITDLATGRSTVVRLPWYAHTQAGDFGAQSTVAVVGSLAVIATSATIGSGDSFPGKTWAEVGVYDARGRRVRQFAIAGRGPDLTYDRPLMQTWIATAGNTAYLLYSDGPSGGARAGLYRITAARRLTGPYRLRRLAPPGAYPDGLVALPGGRVLVETSAAGADASCVALFAFARRRLHRLWRRDIPGASPVQAGPDLVTLGPGLDYGATYTAIHLVAWRTGRTVATVRAPGGWLRPVAMGPFGVIVVGDLSHAGGGIGCTAAVPCPPAPLPATRVALVEADGQTAWQAMLPEALGPDTLLPGVHVLRQAGRYVLPLGVPGLAVVWGGRAAGAQTGGWPYAFAQIQPGSVAAVPAQGAIAGYQVAYDGQAVDAAHPLTVTSAQVGRSLTLTVSPVNAQDEPVPSRAAVQVTVGDGGAGASLAGQPDTATVALAAGQTQAQVPFQAGAAGPYTLTATPDLTAIAGFAPSVPAAVAAGTVVPVAVDLVDANGVAYPVPTGDTVEVLARGGGATAHDVVARPQGEGVYIATPRVGPVATRLTLATQIEAGGRPVGPMSAPVTVTASDPAPPTLTVRAGSRGGLELLVAPAAGTHPVGYALYRAAGAGAAVTTAGTPLAVVDPRSYAEPVATFALAAGGGPFTYTVCALYAEGAEGLPAPTVTVTGP